MIGINIKHQQNKHSSNKAHYRHLSCLAHLPIYLNPYKDIRHLPQYDVFCMQSLIDKDFSSNLCSIIFLIYIN